jgi:hypothetical protein
MAFFLLRTKGVDNGFLDEKNMSFLQDYFIMVKNENRKKGGRQMASLLLMPNSSTTHAKPVIGTAILCVGHNVH